MTPKKLNALAEDVERLCDHVPLEDRPELPPLWEWLGYYGRPPHGFWRAQGPKPPRAKANEDPFEAWGTLEGCANFAWEVWETFSGMTRASFAKFKGLPPEKSR